MTLGRYLCNAARFGNGAPVEPLKSEAQDFGFGKRELVTFAPGVGDGEGNFFVNG